jgi:two-component system, cell cycle sensor histidine kinase and response regulator CckA
MSENPEIRNSEGRPVLRQAAEIAAFPVPSLLISPDGKILSGNVALERILGFPASQWAGEPVESVVASSYREWFLTGVRERLSTKLRDRSVRRIRVSMLRPGGAEFPAEVLMLGSAVEGAPLCLLILPVAPEEAGVAQPEDWTGIMAMSLDQISDGVYWVGPDTRFHYVNEAACASLGLSRVELLKMSIHEVDADSPGSWWEKLWRDLKSRSSSTFESRFRRKDGTLFPVEVTVNHIEFSSREYRCAVVRDLSARKSLEQQLLQAQKMEAVGRLAGGVAHDFNNLITVVMGYSELALRHMRGDDPARVEVGEILNAARKAGALTTQLLAFSRRQALRPVVFNLNDTVRNAARIITRLIGEDVRMVTELAPELGNVRADPSQVEHILFNLAVNARDAMPEGGRLTIQTGNVELDQDYARAHSITLESGDYVMLAVTDTGLGMSRETLGRIFEPFFTTKEHGKGTGLGLSTVYGVVKQSGGHIWVYSEPGQGATFKIYMPRIDAPVDSPGGSLDPVRLEGTETILLVEDNVELLALAGRSLESYGYRILTAKNPEEAMACCTGATGPIDLLVTDVVLPTLDGPKLAALLCKMVPGMKVLYTSGYPDERLQPHPLPEKAPLLLMKPFTPAGLARRVRQTLESQGEK